MLYIVGNCTLQFGISNGYDSPYYDELWVLGIHDLKGIKEIEGFNIIFKTNEFGVDFYYKRKDQLKIYSNQKIYDEYDLVTPLLDDKNQCFEIWINKHLNDMQYVLY